MALIAEVDQEALDEWLSTRPEIIRTLVARVPPFRLYLLKSSNHRVYPYAYGEDGTLTVIVSGEYNAVIFDRQVFGIDPDDLEECDLPPDDEPLGTILTEDEEVEDYIKQLRQEEINAFQDTP